MKTLVVSIIIGCLGYIALKQPITENENIIIWNKNRLLTWDDFKGKPDTTTEYLAVTDCNFNTKFFSNKDTLHISTKCYMECKTSWKKKKTLSTALLKHEQLHFDIAELYVRKLKLELVKMAVTKKEAQKKIDEISKLNTQQFKQYQALYDKETDHSKIKVKQLEWEKKITKELKDLEAYSKPNIKILLKK